MSKNHLDQPAARHEMNPNRDVCVPHCTAHGAIEGKLAGM